MLRENCRVTTAVGNDDGLRERAESGEADSETNGLYGGFPPNLRSPPHSHRETPPLRAAPPSLTAGITFSHILSSIICLSF